MTTQAEIPLRLITQADVRASIRRAKKNLKKAADEIVWQIEMEAWRTLGYRSWDAMREAEYGEAAFMVPRRQRPELVGRMRAAGLTNQEIADTAGISEPTVRRDFSQSSNDDSEPITNARGQQRPANYSTHQKAEPVAADSAPQQVTCPMCGGTGKVTHE